MFTRSFNKSRPLQRCCVVWWASAMSMTRGVCVSHCESSITRWCGRRLPKTPLSLICNACRIMSLVLPTSTFYRSCVAFQVFAPIPGRCAHVTTNPFGQCLPAAVVIITDTMWNILDVVMGTTGAGCPAATPTVYRVQWCAVALILSQRVWPERKKYKISFVVLTMRKHRHKWMEFLDGGV